MPIQRQLDVVCNELRKIRGLHVYGETDGISYSVRILAHTLGLHVKITRLLITLGWDGFVMDGFCVVTIQNKSAQLIGIVKKCHPKS